MGRRKKFVPSEESKKFLKIPEALVDGFLIERGDFIKIKGEHGLTFKFDCLTTNTETGVSWIDCFEFYRGQTGCYRSFSIERVKRVPKRKKRAKRVI